MKKLLFIDLSMPMENKANEPRPPEITYVDHKAFLETNAKLTGLNKEDFHDGLGSAMEYVKVSSHSATHMDAPYHYGPMVEGKPAKTIDQVPLEWCYGDGVVVDMRHRHRYVHRRQQGQGYKSCPVPQRLQCLPGSSA